jgi:hypothetical protein
MTCSSRQPSQPRGPREEHPVRAKCFSFSPRIACSAGDSKTRRRTSRRDAPCPWWARPQAAFTIATLRGRTEPLPVSAAPIGAPTSWRTADGLHTGGVHDACRSAQRTRDVLWRIGNVLVRARRAEHRPWAASAVRRNVEFGAEAIAVREQLHGSAAGPGHAAVAAATFDGKPALEETPLGEHTPRRALSEWGARNACTI